MLFSSLQEPCLRYDGKFKMHLVVPARHASAPLGHGCLRSVRHRTPESLFLAGHHVLTPGKPIGPLSLCNYTQWEDQLPPQVRAAHSPLRHCATLTFNFKIIYLKLT
ncbi:hypothetical protein Baya_16305 [Bagarius yarrelli]|uniref:Uncharacterized protein n=1 Tax=Bagarius yarrelli TaxID=175774 RepID=A0A556VUY9_BAGYA|nr:hypothetical protein Baya_16305 [Bagarius yarrelli]